MNNFDFSSYSNDFSDNGFWITVKKYAKKIGRETLHKSLCLWLVIKEGDAPIWAKTTAVSALGYLISPIDAIPDFMPIVGFTDDIAVIGVAAVTLAAYITEQISGKAEMMLPDWMRK